MTDDIHPDALPLQYRLNIYLVERILGRGGFGITYLARDTNLDTHVAIKEYLPVEVATREAVSTVRPKLNSQRDRYGWGLERFIVEARTLARFDHPSIVRVHTLFEANGTAYMVMRFEEGDNFATLLERRGTIPEEELLAILLPILDGLELVHNANFIHRDIKPDNIHIRLDGTPVLLDFGSARQASGKPRTMTVVVAHGYAPFEQYDGNAESQGPWTDIYGLGATCYRAIAGIAPIDAIARVRGRLGSASDALVPAKTIGKGRYSERFLSAIDAALQFAEKDRPKTVAEWRRQIVGGRRAASTAAESAQRAQPRRATIAWMVAGAAAAAGAAGFFIATRPSPERTEGQKAPAELTRKLEAQETPPPQALQEEPRISRDAAKPGGGRAPRPPVAVAKPAPVPPVVNQPQEPEEKPAVNPPPAAPAPPDAVAGTKPEVKPAEVKPSAASVLEAAGRAETSGNYEGARQMYQSLANQGDGAARLKLGDMYANGRGVRRNYNQAYIWYSLALRSGMSAAEAPRKKAGAMLQPAEINQADSLVDSIQSAAPGR
jgi:serine/threonine protein kinase